MSIVVLGGGAIGLLVAGRLAQSLQHVAVLARPSTVQALAAHPLRITQAGRTSTVERLPVAATPSDLPDSFRHPELVLLCVKGFATTGALPALDTLQPQTILTLQNGIGNEELLAAHVGPERVVSGAITSSVDVESPGAITVRKTGSINLAPLSGTPALALWATMFHTAGFPTRLHRDYRSLKWSKALLNMLGNATSAILDMSVEQVYADRRLVALERRAFLEGLAVMERLGIPPTNLPGYPTVLLVALMQRLPPPLLHPILQRAIAGGRGGKAPSLHIDLRQGRTQLESDMLYGAIARRASDIGMIVPVNTTLYSILNGIASGALSWNDFRGKPERLLHSVGIEP